MFCIPPGSFVAVANLRTNPAVAAVRDEVDAIAPRLARRGSHRVGLCAMVGHGASPFVTFQRVRWSSRYSLKTAPLPKRKR